MELRDRILEAAEEVIRTNGLSKTTTKEIARIADCSEGSLYNHFQSKEDLFYHVLKRHLQGYHVVLSALSGQTGTRTVEENLKDVARAALDFFHLSIVMTAYMFTEPNFLARHRERFQQRNEGPHRSNEIVADYLRAEQTLGRVNAQANPRSMADLLLGACFQHAFHLKFFGDDEPDAARNQFIEDLFQPYMQGIHA